MSQAISLHSGNGFEITATPHQGSLILKFKGSVTEDTQLGELMTVLTPHLGSVKGVLLDNTLIQRINSCGIREWLLFLERLGSKIPYAFLQVGEIFIEQAAVVPNILGKAGTPVLSFQAPFHCPKCIARTIKVLTPKQIKGEAGEYETPSFPCDKCATPLEFDGMEDEYFRFLRYNNPAARA